MLNRGLVIISPIVLVRLISVEDFGRYREFLLYTTLLASFAAFGINSSLLRFVPKQPGLAWRFVNQSVLMMLASSALVVVLALGINWVFGGDLLGEFALPVVLYVLLFVNLDFWEFLWLAEKRSLPILGYTTGRLVARMTVVLTAAALTRDVEAIVWSIICLEAVRLSLSAIGWRMRARTAVRGAPSMWKEQLQYCLPFGAALILITLNSSLGGLFIAKMLGAVALAHYTIGVYVQPIIIVVRNSLSDVVLAEMVTRNRDPSPDPLQLWRRTTVLTFVFLVAAGVLLARFADILVTTLFSDDYLPAAAVMQIYVLVFLRDSMDFGIPLRAANTTAPILRSNALAIAINVVLMLLLLPIAGVIGAVIAYIISRAIEGTYLASQVMRTYRVSLRELASWAELGKVLFSAALAAIVLYGDHWTAHLGLVGVILGGLVYLIAFGALLLAFRIPEVTQLLQLARSLQSSMMRKLS